MLSCMHECGNHMQGESTAASMSYTSGVDLASNANSRTEKIQN